MNDIMLLGQVTTGDQITEYGCIPLGKHAGIGLYERRRMRHESEFGPWIGGRPDHTLENGIAEILSSYTAVVEAVQAYLETCDDQRSIVHMSINWRWLVDEVDRRL
jgi:hypothetical protein